MAKKAKQQRNREHIDLPGGNRCTVPYISPSNWSTKKASIGEKWYLRYTYFDCINRPNGFPVKLEKGMNTYKSLPDRQGAGRQVLADVMRDLKQGLNPITGRSTVQFKMDGEEIKHEFLSPSTSFRKALEWAFDQYPANETKYDIRSYLYIIYPALSLTQLDKVAIRDISGQHILILLQGASKITSRWDDRRKKQVQLNWSDYKYNRILDYLSMLLNKVTQLKVIASNPVHGIPKRTTVSKPKVGLRDDQMLPIDESLK